MATMLLACRLSRQGKAHRVHHRHQIEEREKEMRFINLKLFRKERGMSQKQLVKNTGLPQSTVSYIENGYQEVSESHLETFKRTYPDADFDTYIYESNDYPYSIVKKSRYEEDFRKFEGDWSTPNPICYIGKYKVLLKMGRISISFEGDIIMDRNDGSFERLGYHFIEPDMLERSDLISGLTEKDWFNDELFEDFKRCYPVACWLVGKKPVVQIKPNY